jgi:hypothetical protein
LKLHSDWGWNDNLALPRVVELIRSITPNDPQPNAERVRGTDLEASQRVLDCVARRLVIARCPFRVEETSGHQLLREFNRRKPACKSACRTLLAEVRQPRLEVGEGDFVVDCLLDLHARS